MNLKFDSLTKKVIGTIVSLTSIVMIGTIGYMKIEGWNFIDSIYMTVITMSTVGFREVGILSENGKLFTILVIVFGIAGFVQAINVLFTLIMRDYFDTMIRKRRFTKMINKMKHHFIVCGAGELGNKVIEQLTKNHSKIVVIDKNLETKEKILQINSKILFVEGDATQDDILKTAGIENAECLISTMDDDAQNIFTVLTARELVPDLRIIARCISENSVSKLKKAGANNIISPNLIGAERMATLALKPEIVEFLDSFSSDENNNDIKIETIQIPDDSILIDKSLSQIKLPNRTGVVVIAIKNKITNSMDFNPAYNTIIKKNNLLIVMGQKKQLNLIYELIKINNLEKFDKKYVK